MHRYVYSQRLRSELRDRVQEMHDVVSQEQTVKQHVSLLIGQAVMLVTLALVFVGFQYHAVRTEADAAPTLKSIYSRLRESTKVIAEIDEPSRKHADVLGTENINSASAEIPSSEVQFADAQGDNGTELERDYYTIALVGDSMVDTMGEETDVLRSALEEKYPDTQFVIYNYGKGSRNVAQGLQEFHERFVYHDRKYDPIDKVDPDVIIIGSFAYNPFDPHDRDRHWLTYTQLVQEAQKITPHVYMLAEIAPVRTGFGLTADGIAWEPHTAWVHTEKIIEQLENVIGLSQTLNLPLIDAYTPSKVEGKQEGQRQLISPSDNIHPSDEGHAFIAALIVEKVDFAQIEK